MKKASKNKQDAYSLYPPPQPGWATRIFYIGIDPDVNKSGVAVYNTDSGRMPILTALKYEELREFLTNWECCHVGLEV